MTSRGLSRDHERQMRCDGRDHHFQLVEGGFSGRPDDSDQVETRKCISHIRACKICGRGRYTHIHRESTFLKIQLHPDLYFDQATT